MDCGRDIRDSPPPVQDRGVKYRELCNRCDGQLMEGKEDAQWWESEVHFGSCTHIFIKTINILVLDFVILELYGPTLRREMSHKMI